MGEDEHKLPKPNLAQAIESWEWSHIQGGHRVVIRLGRPRQPGAPIRFKTAKLNEFGDPRLAVLHAVDELEEVLCQQLAQELNRLAIEAHQESGADTFQQFRLRAEDAAQTYTARCRNVLRTLLESRNGHPEMYRGFSLEDSDHFERRLQILATNIVNEALREYSIPWNQDDATVPNVSARGAGNLVTPLGTATNRQAEVDQFLRRCLTESGVKIPKNAIWKAVGHTQARQFEYWQAAVDRPTGEKRGATKADDQNFRRILAMQPAEFLSTLDRLRIPYRRA